MVLKKTILKPVVFWPPFILLLVTLVVGFTNEQMLADVMGNLFFRALDSFGWLYQLLSFTVVVFLVIVFIHPVSKNKFGGPDAKPEFTTWNWFVISLCAGIAVGIAFWGVAEPISVLIAPPPSLGLEPNTPDAALFAMSAGIIVSFGFGVLQLGTGLQAIFGIVPGKVVWTTILVAIVVAYTISSYTGVKKGIRILSNQNAKIFIGLMLFVFILGSVG